VRELAVHGGLDLVQLALVVLLGGQEAAVVLVGAVATMTTTMMTTTTTIVNRATVVGEPWPDSSRRRPHS